MQDDNYSAVTGIQFSEDAAAEGEDGSDDDPDAIEEATADD